jgi:hypothetical protein
MMEADTTFHPKEVLKKRLEKSDWSLIDRMYHFGRGGSPFCGFPVVDDTGCLSSLLHVAWFCKPLFTGVLRHEVTSEKENYCTLLQGLGEASNRNTQQDYINHVHVKTVQDINSCGDNTKTNTTICTNIISKKQNSLLFNFTKPQCGPNFIPQNQSTYIDSIKCTETYTNKQINTANHPPFVSESAPVNYCSNNTGETAVGVNTTLGGNPIGRMITTKNTPSTCKFLRSNK